MKKSISILISLVLTIGIIAPCFMGVLAFGAESDNMTIGTSGVAIEPLGIIDVAPPMLTGISIDKTSVDAPGTVTVTATATDDISGIAYISVVFYRAEADGGFDAYLHNEIYNEETGSYEQLPYFTGNAEIGTHHRPGIYKCVSITLYDKAGNRQSYLLDPDDWDLQNGYLPIPYDVPHITIINPTEFDITAPSIASVALTSAVINAPGNIEVSGTATDDKSGVAYISIAFYCEETKQSLHAYLLDDVYNESTGEYERTGIFVGNIGVGKYQLPGIYTCTAISVYDIAGNRQNYFLNPDQWDLENGYKPLPFSVPSIQVNNNGQIDITPPRLTELTLSKTSVDTPGIIEIRAKALDDISGVNYISINYYCKDSESSLYANLLDERYNENAGEYEKTNEFYGLMKASVYQLPGLYICSGVTVYDYAGNHQTYLAKPDSWDLEHGYLPLPFNIPSITVINDGTFDYASNTNNPSLANEIAALPDGSTVGVDYGSNPQIGADVFAAAQGKDIDVVLIGNGIEWVFNGTDIDNPKALDLSVNIAPIDNSNASNAHEIKTALGSTPAVVLSFPNNGQLPGKAKIRVKADSEFRQYLGVDNLYVYYFNNQTGRLEQVKANVNVTHDGFIEFEITHNSAFVITKGQVSSGTKIPTARSNDSEGSSSDKETTSSVVKVEPQPATITQAISAYNEALKVAKEQGNDQIIVRFNNISAIPLSVIKEINSRAAKDGVSATIYADTVKNAVVLHRIAFDPAKATKDINASVSLDNANAINAANRFNRHFENKIAVIALGQQDSFGVPVRISTKLDLSGIANPVFYSYDLKTNKCSRIQPEYGVDKNGYLSFTAEHAGVIVVSDGELRGGFRRTLI